MEVRNARIKVSSRMSNQCFLELNTNFHRRLGSGPIRDGFHEYLHRFYIDPMLETRFSMCLLWGENSFDRQPRE